MHQLTGVFQSGNPPQCGVRRVVLASYQRTGLVITVPRPGKTMWVFFIYFFFKTKECAKAGTEDVKRGLKMLIIEGKGCFVEGIFNLPTV